MLNTRSVSSAADQSNKCEKSAAAAAGDIQYSPSAVTAGFGLRTFVFPFCWPETFAENQKHFEHFSNISNDNQFAKIHWHEKVILIIAKRIDHIMVSVNRGIWRDTPTQSDSLLNSLSFSEKEQFWKFSYIKLGMRILKFELDDFFKEKENSAAAENKKLEGRAKNLNDNSVPDELNFLEIIDLFSRELEHIMTTIRKILDAHIKSHQYISHVLQLLEQYI